MKTGISISQLAASIQNFDDYKDDVFVAQSSMEMNDLGNLIIGNTEYTLRHGAHGQLASRLGINSGYYNKMLNTGNFSLLADNVNVWLGHMPDVKRFVRKYCGSIRAFLSDRYLPIDNIDILTQAILPVMNEMGLDQASIASCYLEEFGDRMYMKVVNPKVQREVVVGDVVQSGFVVSGSETGNGAVWVAPFIHRLVCDNGMVSRSYLGSYRRNHVRSKRKQETQEISREDKILDISEHLASIREMIQRACAPETLDNFVTKMQVAHQTPIQPEIAVESTALHFQLTQDEKRGVLESLISGDDMSLYGLMNAYTDYSKRVESYDRATEFEEFGSQILDLNLLNLSTSRELALV